MKAIKDKLKKIYIKIRLNKPGILVLKLVKLDNLYFKIWKSLHEKYKNYKIEKWINEFKKQPLISILMPVYNVAENYLTACLESVVNQSYRNWELCITDDASTRKHVKQILNQYVMKENRIKVSYKKTNT